MCKKYGIKNYTINNGLVDVNGDVDLRNLNKEELTKLPIKFGIVSGFFYCSNNHFTSLIGAPQKVGGDFDCYNNILISLKGAPQKVGGDFYGSRNKLTTLEGAPKEVSGNFICRYNQLTSLDGCPQEVGGNFYCSSNNIYRLDFIPNYTEDFHIKDNPFFNVWKLIEDSIEKDYTLFDHFLENNIFRDPGYQGDNSGLPIIILDRLNDFLDMCNLPNVEEVEGYTCI